MNTFREKVSGFIQQIKSNRKLSLIGILLLVAAIPLTVFIAEQQQEIRQRASTNQAIITVAQTTASPGSSLTVNWTIARPTAVPTATPTPGVCSPRPNIVRNVSVDNVNKVVNVTATVGTNTNTPTNTLKSIKFTRISNATLEVPTNWSQTNPGNTTTPMYTFPANTTSVSFKEKRIACGAVTVEYTWVDECGNFTDFSGAGTVNNERERGLSCDDLTPTHTPVPTGAACSAGTFTGTTPPTLTASVTCDNSRGWTQYNINLTWTDVPGANEYTLSESYAGTPFRPHTLTNQCSRSTTIGIGQDLVGWGGITYKLKAALTNSSITPIESAPVTVTANCGGTFGLIHKRSSSVENVALHKKVEAPHQLSSSSFIPKAYAQTTITGAETLQLYRIQTNAPTPIGQKLFLNCQPATTTPPTAPMYAGQCSYPIPSNATSGSYIIRMLAADGTTILGESTVVAVTAASASLTLSAAAVAPGQQFSATWANLPLQPTTAPSPTATPTQTPTPTTGPTPTTNPNRITLTATTECTTVPDAFKSAGPSVQLKWNTIPADNQPTFIGYELHRSPRFTEGTFNQGYASFINQPGNFGTVRPQNGFFTVYDGSYIDIQPGARYDYWIQTSLGESNHVTVNVPTNCPIPSTSPLNFRVVPSCPNGQPAVDVYFNRMPYPQGQVGPDQNPPPTNGYQPNIGSSLLNPRPLHISGSNAFPRVGPYTYTMGGQTVTIPWPCAQSSLPEKIQDLIVKKAHAITLPPTPRVTERAWIGYFPSDATTFARGDNNWKYLGNCSQTPPTTPITSGGSCNFTIQEAGQYKLHIFADDTSNNIVTASPILTVSPPITPTEPDTSPIYRLINSARTAYFWASPAEKDRLVATNAWISEGPIWKSYLTQKSGTYPIYRLISSDRSRYFWATPAEKDRLVATNAWISEGPIWYAYLEQKPGTVPIYRLINSARTAYFWASPAEKDRLVATNAWISEGPIWYASVTPSTNVLTFNTTALLTGIGSPSGTFAPKHPNRNAVITLFNANNIAVATKTGMIKYASASGSFVGTIASDSAANQPAIPAGNYIFKIQTPQFLRKAYSGFLTIQPNATVTVPSLRLTTGDVNGDNKLNILDYHIIVSCFGKKISSDACKATPQFTPDTAPLADLNDDGIVDGIDYNLFLRSLITREGD